MTNLSIQEFADKLDKIMSVIIKEFSRRQTNELYKGEITLPQFLVLEFLRADGELKMKDLASNMHVSTAAMTGIVDRLVRDGYVVRSPDAKDRRIIKIKLVEKGSQIVKKIIKERRQMIIRIFGKISGGERRDYLNILTHIKDVLQKENAG